MDDRRPAALSDEALDRELQAALDVAPSPEFVARVRSRVVGDVPAVRWPHWQWAAAAVAAAAVVIVTIGVRSTGESNRHDYREVTPAPPIATRVPDDVPPRPQPVLAVHEPAPAPTAVRRAAPEVLL